MCHIDLSQFACSTSCGGAITDRSHVNVRECRELTAPYAFGSLSR